MKPRKLYKQNLDILDNTTKEYFEKKIEGETIKRSNKNLDLLKKFLEQLTIIFKRFNKYSWNSPIYSSKKHQKKEFELFSKNNSFFAPYNKIFNFYKQIKHNVNDFIPSIFFDTYSASVGIKSLTNQKYQDLEENVFLFGESY
jgi:hypothetical protein